MGNLLVEGIQAFKAYTNFPGYDLVATNAEKNLSCRVQVKSRWATDFDGGFPIKKFPFEVVRGARRLGSSWNKVLLRHMEDAKGYVSRWDLVRSHLGLDG